MEELKIELLTNEDGDWETLKVNGEIKYSNHRIDGEIWIKLFQELGFKATSEIVYED